MYYLYLLRRLGTAINAIEQLRLEFKAEIAATKTSILKWTIGALIAQGGVIAALIQLSA